MKQDYREYHFTGKEIVKYLIQSILLCGALDYLFYQNKWLMILAIPVSVIFLKVRKKQLIRERRKNLNYQFKDALNALSVAVQAGYSVENAVSACARDLERMYPKDADIVKEFRYMESQLKVSVPVEELFRSLGERCGIEDMRILRQSFTQRSGPEVICQKSSRHLRECWGIRLMSRKRSRRLWQQKKQNRWL